MPSQASLLTVLHRLNYSVHIRFGLTAKNNQTTHVCRGLCYDARLLLAALGLPLSGPRLDLSWCEPFHHDRFLLAISWATGPGGGAAPTLRPCEVTNHVASKALPAMASLRFHHVPGSAPGGSAFNPSRGMRISIDDDAVSCSPFLAKEQQQQR